MRVGEEEHRLVWSFHHLLLDGWSVALLMKEVFSLYRAYSRGEEPERQVIRPYRDYVAWLQDQDLSRAEEFWRKKLKGFKSPTPFTLYQSFDGSAHDSNGCDHYQMKISPETTMKLQRLARENQLTLNAIMQGVWALLLNCYSGEEDVVFGTIVSGRPSSLAGIESMIGLFINTLPVRVRVSPDHQLLPWLKDLQAQQIEMSEYEYSPLIRVQSWSEVPRGVPLFHSILAFENYPADFAQQEKISDLKLSRERSIESTNFPITVMVVPGSQLSLWFVYDLACFRPETIKRIGGHFQAVLENIADNPKSRLLDLLLVLEQQEEPLDSQDSLQQLRENDQFVM